MEILGKLDTEIFRCVAPDVVTDEVIITDERIRHIQEHHPGDYERYSQYMRIMVEAPQYILRDSTPNTAVILQEFSDGSDHFRLILRLAIEEEGKFKKNTVITFLRISGKTFLKYLRNKNILYKSE